MISKVEIRTFVIQSLPFVISGTTERPSVFVNGRV